MNSSFIAVSNKPASNPMVPALAHQSSRTLSPT
jgi:hypothetical protein